MTVRSWWWCRRGRFGWAACPRAPLATTTSDLSDGRGRRQHRAGVPVGAATFCGDSRRYSVASVRRRRPAGPGARPSSGCCWRRWRTDEQPGGLFPGGGAGRAGLFTPPAGAAAAGPGGAPAAPAGVLQLNLFDDASFTGQGTTRFVRKYTARPQLKPLGAPELASGAPETGGLNCARAMSQIATGDRRRDPSVHSLAGWCDPPDRVCTAAHRFGERRPRSGKGPVTGALALLLMATVGDVVSAATQLNSAPPAREQSLEGVPLRRVDAQPVFQLDGVHAGGDRDAGERDEGAGGAGGRLTGRARRAGRACCGTCGGVVCGRRRWRLAGDDGAAPRKAAAERGIDAFVAEFEAKYPKAAACLRRCDCGSE